MINIKSFATGSSGNCHLLQCDNVKILLDCGIGFKKLQTLMKGILPDVVLITHEHSDHANVSTIQQLLNRGVAVAMTPLTAEALNLDHFNLLSIEITGKKPFMTWGDKEIACTAIDVFHDAAEPVNFIVKDDEDTLLYLTDCGEVPPLHWKNFHINKLLIEANYLPERLYNSDIDNNQRQRILDTHLSVDQTLEFIKTLKELDEVHLCHISKRHGNGVVFKELVQMTVPRVKVVIAENKSIGR